MAMVLTNSVFNMVIGAPGAGKTCYAAHIAKVAKRQKIPVYTNYPMRGCYKLFMDEILKLDMRDSIIIIDEAGGEYNSRGHKEFTGDKFRWFATARHRKQQIFFIVQNWARLDVALRELATTVIFIKKSIILGTSWKNVFNSQVKLTLDEEGNATEFKPLFSGGGFGVPYFRFKDYKDIDTYYDAHEFTLQRRELWEFNDPPKKSVSARIRGAINRIIGK